MEIFTDSLVSWGELFAKGGVLMYPLAACSLIALAIIFERLYSLRRKFILPRDVVLDIEGYLDQGRIDDAVHAARKNDSPVASILEAGLINASKPRHIIREVMEEAGRREVSGLERYITLLGIIAGVAPLIGLLGTVVGMIKAFSVIADEGIGNPTLLAGGISEALFTTAAGLTVAIPAFIMHRYFLARVDTLAGEMGDHAQHIAETLDELNASKRDVSHLDEKRREASQS